MTTQRRITCPHGCDPDDMEREPWQAADDGEPVIRREVKTLGAAFGARYLCHGCGWEADWNPKDGLRVNVRGD